ncbi:collagen alpha-1(I) chain-like isoform X1 [Aphelocoma coerulescens]|uniref:collagen alpha-1(I) chain-like isoform X1 n=2 Tax=Aphelocoma coerulescens TaxID=39617 RepID=UPI0036049B27
MRSARPAAFSRRDGGALTGAAVPAVPGAGSGLWRGAGRCPGGWSGLPLGAGEPPLAKGPGWGSCAGSRFAPPGSAVRAERPWDVCGDGRGVPELGPGVSTSSPTWAPGRPAAPGRDGRSGRAGAVPGARGCPRAGACPAGKPDVVEKGARRCSGTWNPHRCFPNVLAEIRPWGSCRGGCPAQLRRMGLPRLSSPGGRGACSRPVLPVQFGNSTGDGPRGSAWDAAPAGAALGTVAREDEPRDTGDAAAAVPRRAGGPASRRLPGTGLGEASTRRLARLRSPMEEAGLPAARSSSSATSAPGSESGPPSSRLRPRDVPAAAAGDTRSSLLKLRLRAAPDPA